MAPNVYLLLNIFMLLFCWNLLQIDKKRQKRGFKFFYLGNKKRPAKQVLKLTLCEVATKQRVR